MKWIIDNWFLLIAFFALFAVGEQFIYKFFHKPKQSQIANCKEWLKWAVLQAEKELGKGTGQAKLRKVYDMAIAKFSWLSVVSFDTFSSWVDDALKWLNIQLEENTRIKEYVEKEN